MACVGLHIVLSELCFFVCGVVIFGGLWFSVDQKIEIYIPHVFLF